MKWQLTHRTAYLYSEPASLSQNELFLTPRSTISQDVLDSWLVIVPEPQYLKSRIDFFGNMAQVFMVQQPHQELTMTTTSVVETRKVLPVRPETTPPWEDVVQQLRSHKDMAELDAYQYVFVSPLTAISQELQVYARASFSPGIPVLSGALHLMERVFSEFTYDKSATTVDTSVEEVFSKRKGVCQDFAHLTISCLRSLGLAARYVSGYLETIPPPGKQKLEGADASHAWLALFVPGAGWVDLDPTNNIIPGETHITLAWGRDYSDVTPVKGVVMGGGLHTLQVMVDVSRLT